MVFPKPGGSVMQGPGSVMQNPPRKIQPPKLPKVNEQKLLHKGELITTEREEYQVERLLGKGGFGSVYKLRHRTRCNEKFAMKTENIKIERKVFNRLKVEMTVFEEIQRHATVDKSHFVRMVDKGKTADFKFIIMELVSYSLWDVIKKVMNNKLDLQTIMYMARHMLKSIEALHEVGWLHRDLKPQNFAIGLPPNDANIFMLDFGIARKYRDEDGKLRIPRVKVAFVGTARYASYAALDGKEQSRQDDLEAWVYIILEMLDSRNFLWCQVKYMVQTVDVIKLKKVMITETRKQCKQGTMSMPEPFISIIEEIDSMTSVCTPKYEEIYKKLDEILKAENLDPNAPPPWIGKFIEKDPDQDEKERMAKEKPAPVEKKSDKKKEKSAEKIVEVKHSAGRMKEKARVLEKELAKIYKELGRGKTREEIRRDILRDADMYDDDEDSGGEDDSSDRRTKQKKKKKRSAKRKERTRQETENDEDEEGSESRTRKKKSKNNNRKSKSRAGDKSRKKRSRSVDKKRKVTCDEEEDEKQTRDEEDRKKRGSNEEEGDRKETKESERDRDEEKKKRKKEKKEKEEKEEEEEDEKKKDKKEVENGEKKKEKKEKEDGEKKKDKKEKEEDEKKKDKKEKDDVDKKKDNKEKEEKKKEKDEEKNKDKKESENKEKKEEKATPEAGKEKK